MYFISYIERSSSLTNIFQWAIQTLYLIHAASVIFICMCVMFQCIIDCVLCARSYSKLRVFKKLGYLSYLFSAICKFIPFLWYFGSSCIFCFCGCDSGFSCRFVLYSFFCIMCYSVFLFVLIPLLLDMCITGLVDI
jgi:hypothetical protein